MGEHVVNAKFQGHAQPQEGAESQHLHLHHEDEGIDETHDLTLTQWQDLCGAVRDGDRPAFVVVLAASIAPTGGWDDGRKDAAWRAGCRTWDP